MVEAFPYHHFLAKRLQSSSGFYDLAEDAMVGYPFDCCLIARCGYPKPFDANICSTEGPLINIAKPTKCERLHGSE